jgi:p-aminobenzoyl-glutamate transporter AbgT
MVGHIMADAVMLVIPPLAAMVFKAAAGRHPVAGLRGSFAAAGAAYSTSFLVTPGRPAVRDHRELPGGRCPTPARR